MAVVLVEPMLPFLRSYARLAARTHVLMGFGPCQPKYLPWNRVIKEFFHQAILVWLVSAPLLFVIHFLPSVVSRFGVVLVTLAWQLQRGVVTVVGEARVLERVAREIPILQGLTRRFAGLCDRYSIPMREELMVVEKHPAIASGFAVSSAVSSAVLLAVPGVNLFLRPLTLIAASHVSGQLERMAARAAEQKMIQALPVSRNEEGGMITRRSRPCFPSRLR